MTDVLAAVHDDGHVGAFAINQLQEHRLQTACDLLGTGWRVAPMSVGAAIVAELQHERCNACHVTFACGCTLAIIASGACPHPDGEAVTEAARQFWLIPQPERND